MKAAITFVAIPNSWEAAYGTPASHWTVQSSTSTDADVTDGRAILYVHHQANGTWFVYGGSYCAVKATPTSPKPSPTPAATGPACPGSTTAVELDLASGASGQRTPLAAAQTFTAQNRTALPGFGKLDSVWQVLSSNATDAMVSDGTTWLDITHLPDNTWAVISASRCT